MKHTWMATFLAALLVLPLAGCGGNKTGTDMTVPSPSVQPSQSLPSMMPDPADGREDLAGADGVVGQDGEHGTGNTGNENAPGQADNSPLEDLGEGVRDTMDDLGEGARNALDDAGAKARSMGRDAKNALEGR